MSDLDLTLVLAERDVPHPMQALDAPLTLPAGPQQDRSSACRSRTADRVLNFGRLFTFTDGRAFQTTDLLRAGPGQMLG